VLELWRLPLGEHTLEVSATDRAGNTATTALTFTTGTSIADLRRLVERFADEGKIGPKLEKRLLEHLSLAARWIAEGRNGKAIKELQAFNQGTQDVRDNAVRSALKRDASWLIDSLD
jgi:hypothetical protein